ncbi:MAG: phage holin family protein [Acidobacteria bacterium]|uniref:Phage holin family protein n=1 Tax=Candidatus Polarisedimenticola svalbardensis TaxID=2886004 RepID=A0A8J6XUU9_9BACT|nr:phage holin family protein [Candidatus Polarisedimenticola svalbardensis]
MVRFLMHFVVVALGLAAATKIVPGVQVDSLTTLLIAALVLGFVNAVIRPILTFLTLPITCLTLGLFYLVVNGLAFTLAAYVVPGFHVESFGYAILGALVVSVVSWFIGLFGDDRKK